MIPVDAARLLACPDCRGDLAFFPDPSAPVAVSCASCRLLHVVLDGIPVLLPRRARHPQFERAHLAALERPPAVDPTTWTTWLDETHRALDARAGAPSWEWEDEAFWSREYSEHAQRAEEKNWNDRLWQREFVVGQLLARASLDDAVLVDVGCGEGQDFRHLIAPRCPPSTLYVAADISLPGLRLNRARNPHRRALYVLATADALPLRPDGVDVLCYFGILHHTEGKARTLQACRRLLREGGYIVLHEALDRPSPLPSFLRRDVEESAHEERIQLADLRAQLRDGLELLASREAHSPLYGAMVHCFPRAMTTRRPLFDAVLRADVHLTRVLGPSIPIFRPGDVQWLLRQAARGAS